VTAYTHRSLVALVLVGAKRRLMGSHRSASPTREKEAYSGKRSFPCIAVAGRSGARLGAIYPRLAPPSSTASGGIGTATKWDIEGGEEVLRLAAGQRKRGGQGDGHGECERGAGRPARLGLGRIMGIMALARATV
jgi:hypothetical protein